MTFGEKLHRLRREKGVSQEALAAELGVSRQAVSRWELGEVVPDTANVLGVSRIFGVSTDYLLLDACDEEGDTPAAKTAQRSLRERQMAAKPWIFPPCGAVRQAWFDGGGRIWYNNRNHPAEKERF